MVAPQHGRIKLLVMTDTAILGPGGSERFLRNLLQRLPADRYAIDVLQLSDPPAQASRVGAVDAPGVRFMHRPIGAVYGSRGLATYRFVRGCVLRGHYDIVQSQHEKSDLINALLPARVGKISNRRDMGFQKSARLRSLFRRINRRFDFFVAPTPAILDALVADEDVDPGKCRAIANGVDTTRFHGRNQALRDDLRFKLGLAGSARLIGCVASFSPVKRHVDLIAAFAELTSDHPAAHLILVGEGALEAEIREQVAALRLAARVHFLGPRNDVENILPALDIFALASSTEGMSNAILEAQACGLAVVATAVGGNRDLVGHDGVGLLVPPLAPHLLADALGSLLGDPPRSTAMGEAARVRIVAEHSLDAMTAAYEGLYQGLVNVR